MGLTAIIPAKGTSRRVPGKNVRVLGRRPLVWWTINAAELAGNVDKVVVSTDSQHVVDVVERGCEENPHWGQLRIEGHPPLSSNPEAPDVALYVVDRIGNRPSIMPESVVMLLPTSPFRTARHVEEAVDLHMSTPGQPNVLSVSEHHHHKNLRMKRGRLYRDPWHNGAILVARTERLLRDGFFSPHGALAYWVPADAGIDINTEEDWALAQKIACRRKYTMTGHHAGVS